ncbi:sulfatase-like hydrolase/transferase [Carboxylicivirga sp. RSCT41]|uniref:sulfatase-like hydrolase/transferase n=1 Tax=Carboxylicivirga agarovorans TaxID=3417570 RepID=UPI003D34FA2B
MYRLICALLVMSSVLKAQQTQPNVLFILADDLGINALNCYGNQLVESPNIDQLFESGMHFTNGYANDPTCAPSRAAIMTGQLAPRTSIYRVIDRYKTAKNAREMRRYMKYLPPVSAHLYSGNSGLCPDKLNMARVFNTNGYATAAFGKWHLGTGTSAMHNIGFDEAIETKNHFNFKSIPSQNDYDSLVYNADYCTKKGIDFMTRSVQNNQAFFLYMPYYLVHAPFDPKPQYVRHFQNKLRGTEYEQERVIDVLAMIRSLDDSVGELMQALTELGVDDNTIIIFTSDNGHYRVKDNNIFALPYKGNKGDVWEGGIRVPYIFKWPEHINGSTSSDSPIVHVDLLPTLADMLDLKMDKSHVMDGISLKKVLLDKGTVSRDIPLVWFYTNYSGFNSKTKQFQSKWVNVIQHQHYKLIEDVETAAFELYDLQRDPVEQSNIISEKPELAQKLMDKLEMAKKRCGLPMPLKNPEFVR